MCEAVSRISLYTVSRMRYSYILRLMCGLSFISLYSFSYRYTLLPFVVFVDFCFSLIITFNRKSPVIFLCRSADGRQGLCYTAVNRNGQCKNRLAMRLSKKDCCCGKNMGRGWGDECFICPNPGSGAYFRGKISNIGALSDTSFSKIFNNIRLI